MSKLGAAWDKNPTLQAFLDLNDISLKKMFGGGVVYQMRGEKKIQIAHTGGSALLSHNDEKPEWQGLCVATDYAFQESLMAEFPDLKPHLILKKWLHISDKHERFESTLSGIVDLVRRRDARIGVEAGAKKGTIAKPCGKKTTRATSTPNLSIPK
jgi:hypothetical protein